MGNLHCREEKDRITVIVTVFKSFCGYDGSYIEKVMVLSPRMTLDDFVAACGKPFRGWWPKERFKISLSCGRDKKWRDVSSREDWADAWPGAAGPSDRRPYDPEIHITPQK